MAADESPKREGGRGNGSLWLESDSKPLSGGRRPRFRRDTKSRVDIYRDLVEVMDASFEGFASEVSALP